MADAASCGGEASPSQRYEKVEVKLLGEGTYGEVFKVKDNVTNEILAMKKMKLHDEEEGTYCFDAGYIRSATAAPKLLRTNIYTARARSKNTVSSWTQRRRKEHDKEVSIKQK